MTMGMRKEKMQRMGLSKTVFYKHTLLCMKMSYQREVVTEPIIEDVLLRTCVT